MRAEAEQHLQALVGSPDATLYDDQWAAIEALAVDRRRALVVQRTGWGKSAVYFVATALLRARGAGPTVIISPLLALMRNQIEAAERAGITAVTINSTNSEQWQQVHAQISAGEVDVLLVSPERLNNPGFRDEVLPRLTESAGLLVIDEAHCISDWGHDFRPDYRRIGDMLEQLPGGVGVLCTTATANDRVVADVSEQLRAGRGAGALRAYRGPLGRSSLRFEVVDLPAQADRLAWLAQHLPELPGSGIVYTLTKRDADLVAAFLTARGIAAESYSGEVDTDTRVAVEDRLLRNDLKAVVATSALGMGYDKPDLGFVVHYQAPGSVISYYQQVGRAGRGIDRAEVVLLRGAEDKRIQDFFIEQAFPRREVVDRVLGHLDDVAGDGASTQELMAQVNLGKVRIEGLLKVLDVEGAVDRAGTKWIARPTREWVYDAERYGRITDLRRHEQAAMASFGSDGRCLMRALQEELDDPEPADCGRCSVCAGPRWDGPLDELVVRDAAVHLRSRPVVLDVKKMAPGDDGRMRKIPEPVRAEEGRALARFGDGGWDKLVQAGRASGRFDDELVAAAAETIRGWGPPGVAWVAAVPSSRSGTLVPDFAARLAAALGLTYVEALTRVDERPPQREMANAPQQVANVRGAFSVTQVVEGAPALLVDDLRFSGWTLAMLGGQLRQKGAGPVYPFALATAF
jgi:ATP-dependent DNA helicase RecQ